MGLESVKGVIINALKKGNIQVAETLVFPLFDSFDRDDLKGALEAVKSVLGEPDMSDRSVDELEHDQDQAVYVWKVKEGSGGYSLKFTMRMSFQLIGYSRLWSKAVESIHDLIQKASEGDLAYDVTYAGQTSQPIGP